LPAMVLDGLRQPSKFVVSPFRFVSRWGIFIFMFRCLAILNVLALAAGSLLAQTVAGDDAFQSKHKALVERLGAASYKVRNQASMDLWKNGLEILPLLKANFTHKDPEVRLRSYHVYQHLSDGYLPGLSPEALAMVESYHEGDRYQALADLVLADEKGHDVASLLLTRVKDKDTSHDLVEYVGHRVREKAWALIKAKEEEEGRELFERSYQFTKPQLKNHRRRDEANLWNGFAWDCALSRQHLDEGLDAVNEALRRNPRDTTFLDTKAEILFVQGDRAAAIKLIKQAIAMGPKRDPQYYQKQLKRFIYSDAKSLPDY